MFSTLLLNAQSLDSEFEYYKRSYDVDSEMATRDNEPLPDASVRTSQSETIESKGQQIDRYSRIGDQNRGDRQDMRESSRGNGRIRPNEYGIIERHTFDLIIAAANGDERRVKEMLKDGANPNVQDINGDTALMKAAALKGVGDRLIRILAKYGADLNLQNESGYTALRFASTNDNRGEVKSLLQYGANPNITDKSGNTVLMGATLKNNEEMVRLLIKHGANLNTQSREGYTALMYSALNDYDRITDMLIRAGANLNTQARDGNTAMILAAFSGKKGSVEDLLNAGADAGIYNKDGNTALILASAKGYDEIVRVFYRSKYSVNLDPNVQNNRGNTALMYASYGGYLDVVETLSKLGSDTSLVNYDGLSATMLAYQRGHVDLAQYLQTGKRPRR